MHVSYYPQFRQTETYVQFLAEEQITPTGQPYIYCTKYSVLCNDEKGDKCEFGTTYIGSCNKTGCSYAYNKDMELVRGNVSRGKDKCPGD